MNEFQKAQNVKILSCYNTDEALSELQKAEILDIEKGGKRALIGEKRTFGGREYIKTAEGWKFHGKGTGTKAQEHAAGATTKTEEKVESTSLPKVDDIYTHPESGKKYRVRAVNEKSGKIKYKQEGSELTQETDIKKFTEMLKPASESPKVDTPSKPDEPTIGSKVKLIGDNKEREYRITDINDKGEVKLFNKYVISFWISKDKLLSPASESPKAEESTSTDSHSAAEIKKKALEIMRAKGNTDVKLSDFTIRQARQVIKEHEMLGSKEAPKTEKVAEEKIENILNHIQEQTGLKLKIDSDSGVKTMKREKYFNVLLDQRVSESEDYPQLEGFANKYKTIRVEPNGHKRVAIFFK